jgi:hypothetical protein
MEASTGIVAANGGEMEKMRERERAPGVGGWVEKNGEEES